MSPRTTVLVIDDEEMIGTLLSEILRREGYSVVTALSGILGLQEFVDHQDELACVVLDLGMPDLDGEEVFYKIKNLGLSIPIIFTSGGGERLISGKLSLSSIPIVTSFLAKPFTPEEITNEIKSIVSTNDSTTSRSI